MTVGSGAYDDAVKAGVYYRIGPQFNASAALLGKTVTDVTFYLKKTGSPTGTGYYRCYDSGNNLVAEWGSIDISTIATSHTPYKMSGASRTLVSGDRIVFESNNGDGSNYIGMNTNSPEAYDGTNTHTARYNGGWNNITDQDVQMVLEGY